MSLTSIRIRLTLRSVNRAQLRKADQEVTATAMIHKLKGYSTKGKSYNNYLFAMYRDNQRLIAAHM